MNLAVSTAIHPSSPRRDLLGGVVWTALGCVIVVLSWQMDRMTQQGATLHTAPGLWPGIVGTLLAALGGVLMLRSWRRAQRIGWDAAEPDDTDYAPRSSFALAAAMFFVYALLLVGRGLPFWLATALFVTAFVFLFQHAQRKGARHGTPRGDRRGARLRRAHRRSSCTLVFEQLFYVRLP